MHNFSACACSECQSACARPGWFTPREALAAMAAGYGNRLMLDYWEGEEEEEEDDRVCLLCPANPGYEGRLAPDVSVGFFRMCSELQSGCTFQTSDGQCAIHAIKPLECRAYLHDDSSPIRTKKVFARMWSGSRGKAIVTQWQERYGKESVGP